MSGESQLLGNPAYEQQRNDVIKGPAVRPRMRGVSKSNTTHCRDAERCPFGLHPRSMDGMFISRPHGPGLRALPFRLQSRGHAEWQDGRVGEDCGRGMAFVAIRGATPHIKRMHVFRFPSSSRTYASALLPGAINYDWLSCRCVAKKSIYRFRSARSQPMAVWLV